MQTSEQCQGKNCERKAKCERYTDTKNWPFSVMSKLCDGRYTAFVPKTTERHAPAAAIEPVKAQTDMEAPF